MENKDYIDFLVTPYALVDVLIALHNEGIRDINVTKEDNDLHIRLDVDYVKEVVYKLKRTDKNEVCTCDGGKK